MRTSLPWRRTLPSSTVATASSSAIFRTLTFLPLKAKAEVRDTTRTPSTFASALITSSVIPSEKYSASFSGLMFTNGSTATDGAAGAEAEGTVLPARVRETKCQATAATPSSATPVASRASSAPEEGGPPSVPSRSVRSMPLEETSNTQARTRRTGKPTPSATTTKESVHSGKWRPCTTGSTTWSTAKATIAYPSSARNTRLRFSSASSDTPKRPPRRTLAPVPVASRRRIRRRCAFRAAGRRSVPRDPGEPLDSRRRGRRLGGRGAGLRLRDEQLRLRQAVGYSPPPFEGSYHAVQEALPAAGSGRRDGGNRFRVRWAGQGPGGRRQEPRGPRRRHFPRRRDGEGAGHRRRDGKGAGQRRWSRGRRGRRLVTDAVRRAAGEAWAFRARVEREAASRFARLAAAIPDFDPGSPVPGLLRRAAGDEDRHAALCAGLSAAYGCPAGGGATDVRIAPGSLGPRDAVLYEMVAACCITETESVATLATLLGERAEPRVRTVLREIARDEVVHGRMGWAHLAREAAVRDVSFLSAWVPSMLAGTVEAELFSSGQPGADELRRHGVLPGPRKKEIFVRTLAEVVLPGLEKLGVSAAPARAWIAQRIG